MRRIVCLAVVVSLAVGLVGCSSGEQDEQPTMTYDGSVAEYSGPSEFEGYPEAPMFRLVNNSDKAVDFYYVRVNPEALEGVTEQEAIEWNLNNDTQPPWISGSPQHLAMRVQGGETVDAEATLMPGNTYELGVWSLWHSRAIFAGWIEATEPAN